MQNAAPPVRAGRAVRRTAAAVVTVLTCLLAGAAPASAGIPTDLWAFDGSLTDFNGEDYAPGSGAGTWVGEGVGMATAAGCDVTGDGVDDVIAGAPWAKVAGVADTGRVYVIPGGERAAGDYDLSSASAENPPAGAIVLRGDSATPSRAGIDVACAGDVDGDGTDDVLIGQGEILAPAYVVFGGDLPAEGLDLAAIGAADRGFAITDTSFTYVVGDVVEGVGDVDGDGKDDIALGDFWASAAVVVLGRGGGDTVDLASDAPHLAFVGAAGSGSPAIAAAGDVDGDEVPDLLVGRYWEDGVNGASAGVTYVVSGEATGTVDPGAPGDDVLMTIEGPRAGAGIGRYLSTAGDANGDGLADIAIGNLDLDGVGSDFVSDALVVYGRASGGDVDLATLEADDGYAIASQSQVSYSARLGTAMASAGDVDGDGRDDLLLGAPWLDVPGVGDAGAVYVVFGRSDGEPVDLTVVSCGESAAMLGDRWRGGLGASVAAATGFGGGETTEIVVGSNASGSGTSGNFVRAIPVADVPGECELPPTEPVTFGSGQLEWGVKETFRNYIVGPIAQGSYEARDGATKLSEPNGLVRFDVLGGEYDPADGSGELIVDGTVAFTGHHGQLQLLLRNLRVELAGSTGTLYGDLTSRSLADGQDRAYPGIALATLTVPALSGIAGGVAVGPIATALTADAAPAFELYTAGTILDPISVEALYGKPRERPDRGGEQPPGGETSKPPADKPAPPADKPKMRAFAVHAARRAVRVGRGGGATIARLSCGDKRCRIAAPRRARLRVGERAYRVAVTVPRSLRPGRSALVRVKLPKGARRALAGRRGKLRLRLSVVAGGRRTTHTVKATLKAVRVP